MPSGAVTQAGDGQGKYLGFTDAYPQNLWILTYYLLSSGLERTLMPASRVPFLSDSCYSWIPETLLLIRDRQGLHLAPDGINNVPSDTLRFVKMQICVFFSHRKCSPITASKYYSRSFRSGLLFTQRVLLTLHPIAGCSCRPAVLDSLISELFVSVWVLYSHWLFCLE